MKRSFTIFNVVFVGVFMIIIGSLIFKGIFVSRAINSGKTLYQIDVNNYNNHEIYITDKYIVDQNTKCLSFKDEMGIKRIVCNNYTITEY
jgi:hypothetical protein